ncbi:hypothetical protein [Chondromyces apiculatus]|uniref:DUF4351 domain-containing protein n=1 Tax=Chondromyces apiculatus DSM 436 TaxID=1192034 RepID=A0A017TI23_9BACT|nr:hypothetical protein [Chondromyces apiculatus]EYF08522.1 Hypothetical protein CAP_4052 [Chondromyces apiculatus DSM 436]
MAWYDICVDAQEWYQQQLEEAEQRGRFKAMARLYGIRLGRPLTEAESANLAQRLDRLGEERVGEVMLTSSPDALARWLSDPAAQ